MSDTFPATYNVSEIFDFQEFWEKYISDYQQMHTSKMVKTMYINFSSKAPFHA